MTNSRKYAVILLAALAIAAAAAFSLRAQPQEQVPVSSQPPSTPPANPNLIVLDPAHGGIDTGAVLADKVFEKDVTLAVANRLKESLTAAGFTVIETRSADSGDPLTTDQRAEIANRAHAAACIVLQATATGSGVHVYTSVLEPPPDDGGYASQFIPVPWDTAQSGYLQQSLSLAGSVSNALGKDHLPPLVGKAPLRPLDNLMCPAVAIELAPLSAPGVGATPVTDVSYQQQIAATLTRALKARRDHPGDLAADAASPVSQSLTQAKAIAAAEAAGRAASAGRASSVAVMPRPAQKGTQ